MTTQRTKPTHPGLARPGARANAGSPRVVARESAVPLVPGLAAAPTEGAPEPWPEESPTFPTGPISEPIVRPNEATGPARVPRDELQAPSDTVPPAPSPDDGPSLAGDEPPEREPVSDDDGASQEKGDPSAPPLATPNEDAHASDVEEARDLSHDHLRGLLEALVFAADKPISAGELARMASAPLKHVKAAMAELRSAYVHRGIVLDEIAGGWSFRTHVQFGPFVREMTSGRPVKLTRAQVETLAIVAYRQPMTRPEIDDIRGVDSGATLKLLLERDLVRILGKKDEPGRPILYGTTVHFLEFFGLKSLKDLPTLREFTELSEDSRRVAESALGELVDPGSPAASSSRDEASPTPGTPIAAASVDEALPGQAAPTNEAGSHADPRSQAGPREAGPRGHDATLGAGRNNDAPSGTVGVEGHGARHDTVVPDAPPTGEELDDPADEP